MGQLKQYNDWWMLADEQDAQMLEFSKNYSVDDYRTSYPWHQYLLRDLIPQFKNTRTAIDIGASYGWFTVAFANIFNNVHAFELQADVREGLLLNTYLDSKIKVYNCGLSDFEGIVSYQKASQSGVTSIQEDANNDCVGLVKPLDSFEITNVDFIKIDVEAYENNVIAGAKETISLNKPLILCEVDNIIITKSLMKSLGYKLKNHYRKKDYLFTI